jgi:hypothetical protein
VITSFNMRSECKVAVMTGRLRHCTRPFCVMPVQRCRCEHGRTGCSRSVNDSASITASLLFGTWCNDL